MSTAILYTSEAHICLGRPRRRGADRFCKIKLLGWKTHRRRTSSSGSTAMDWNKHSCLNVKMLDKRLQWFPCNTVAFEIRLMYGGGIWRTERRHLLDAYAMFLLVQGVVLRPKWNVQLSMHEPYFVSTGRKSTVCWYICFFESDKKKCLCKPWFLCLTLFDVHTNTVGKYRWKLHLPTRVTEIHFFHFHAEPCFPNGSKCSRVCNSLFNACFPNYIHQTKRHIQLHLIFFHPQAGFNIIGCNPAKQCKAIIGHKSSPS